MVSGCQVVRYMIRHRAFIKRHQRKAFLFRKQQHTGVESAFRGYVRVYANLSEVDCGFSGPESLANRRGNLLVEQESHLAHSFSASAMARAALIALIRLTA